MRLYLITFSLGNFISWCDEKFITKGFKKWCSDYTFREMTQDEIDYYHSEVVDALFHSNTLIYLKRDLH